MVLKRDPKSNVHLLTCLIVLLCLSSPLVAYPELKRLDRTDVLFKQLHEDVDLFYRNYAQGAELPPLMIFSYVANERDDLLSIAARTNISASTIASLNGFSSPQEEISGRTMMIPNQKGIFIAVNPSTELERLVNSVRMYAISTGVFVKAGFGPMREFLFLPGEDFNAVERSFFLGILFRFPLPLGTITSSFGTRANPFTGHPTFHNGVDIGAPFGTEVLAARGGVVMHVGFDPILGLHALIKHEGGYETVYGHLSACFLELNQLVDSGTIIGEVGTSGASTGPHLHFEIRKGTASQDPLKYIQNGNS